MSLRSILMGRKQSAPDNPDHLLALPAAIATLREKLDLVPSGSAGLCFKLSGDTVPANDDILKMFELPDVAASITTDDVSFQWLLVTASDPALTISAMHAGIDTLSKQVPLPKTLCAVFGFIPASPPGEGHLYLVYLVQHGTFYPFCPTDGENRNSELELRARTFLEHDLHMEQDLGRWMALWGLPVH